MAIDLDVVTRLNRATAREAAREAQQYFKDAGDGAGKDFGDGLSKGLTSKVPEIEKALNKVTDASGKVLVEQEKLNAMKDKANVTDTQRIAQSERLAKAHRAEEQAIRDVNRAMDEHNAKSNEVVTKTRNLGDEASKAANKIGDLGGALRGLGAVGAIGMLPAAATAITEVAGALQQLSGAALAGPGIFAGLAASAGTAALGMQGMSNAFDASIKALDGTKTHVEAANKALAEISPTAADAVKSVVGLKGTFDSLRDVAATNIFQGFSGNLKNLVSADLPVLTRGIDGISKGLGQNLAQVMASLGSSSSQGFLDRILGNTGNAQSKLTAAIDPIVHAVGVLTAAGSDTLPRLAAAVGSVADRFNAFITTADANSNLAKWIDKGLDGFTQLGNTVLNIGKTFTALTEAAGGGTGLLGTLESATGKLQTFLNSAQGQADLQRYFAQGRDMLSQLKDIAVSAGPVLAGMFQAAASTTQVWLPVIKQILDIINGIPGGAQAVVAAFVAWESIKGVAALATSLGNIANLLKLVLPAAAVEGAGGISAALAGITLPAWMTALMAAGGGAAATVALLAGGSVAGSEALDAYAKAHPEQTTSHVYGPGGAARRSSQGGGTGWSGGGGGTWSPTSVDPTRQPAPGYGASVDPTWTPNPSDPIAKPGTYRRRDGLPGTIPTPAAPGAPGLSSYSPPVITSGASGSGPGSKTPFIDPSKFQGGDPLAGLPAPSALADPQAVYEADSRALTAGNNLAQGKLALAVLEAKGTATQQELLTAKNNVAEQERALYDAQFKDLEARQGKMAKASSDLQSIFAPLDQDFGISGGIPGIVKNLVTFLGNTALAGAIASSPALQSAALSMMSSPKNGAASPTLGSGGYGGPTGAYPSASYGVPAGANVYTGAHTENTGGALVPDAAAAKSLVQQMFGIKDIGGYRAPDGYNEHSSGEALDIMIGTNKALGQQVNQFLLQNANALGLQYTLFEQTQWNPNGTSSGMEDRGSPTQNHMDHVHARFQPGALASGGGPSLPMTAGAPAPIGIGSPASAPSLSGLPLPLPVTIVGGPGIAGPPVPGAPGPSTLAPGSAGGPPSDPYAPAAIGPAPIGGGNGAPTSMGWPNPGIPGSVNGGGGQGPVFGSSPKGPGAGASTGFNTGIAPQGGGGPGLQLGGAGFDGAMMAAGALDLMAPGAGQAAQIGIKLGKRAIEYGGQVAGIGASGLAETFLPSGSALGNFGNSWFGKIAGGVAGARPAKDNMAGKGGATPPQQGQPGQGDQQGQPGQPPITVNYTNNQATEDRAGKDLTNHLSTMNSSPGPGNPRG